MTGKKNSESPKNAKTWGFGDFDKNQINSYILFPLEYESTNDLLVI